MRLRTLPQLVLLLLFALPVQAQPEAPWVERYDRSNLNTAFSTDTLVIVRGTSVVTSVDTGATWVETGLNAFTNDDFNELTPMVRYGGAYYVGAFNSGGALFRSDGDFTTWTRDDDFLARSNNGRTQDVRVLLTDGNAMMVYADVNGAEGVEPGFFFTSDGETWTETATNPAYLPVGFHEGRLFGTSNSGIATSDDQGATWTPSTVEWVEGNRVRSLANGPNDTAYAVAYGELLATPRLYQSTDDGNTWTDITGTLGIEEDTPIFRVYTDTRRVFVDVGSSLTAQILVSGDAGQSWNVVGPRPRVAVNAFIADDGGLAKGFIAGDYFYAETIGRFRGTFSRISLEEVDFGSVPTAADRSDLPVTDGALMVYPNPAQDRARVALTLESPVTVRVEAFDVLGRRIGVLHDGPLPIGTTAFTFETQALAPGIYFIRTLTPDLNTLGHQTVVVR